MRNHPNEVAIFATRSNRLRQVSESYGSQKGTIRKDDSEEARVDIRSNDGSCGAVGGRHGIEPVGELSVKLVRCGEDVGSRSSLRVREAVAKSNEQCLGKRSESTRRGMPGIKRMLTRAGVPAAGVRGGAHWHGGGGDAVVVVLRRCC